MYWMKCLKYFSTFSIFMRKEGLFLWNVWNSCHGLVYCSPMRHVTAASTRNASFLFYKSYKEIESKSWMICVRQHNRHYTITYFFKKGNRTMIFSNFSFEIYRIFLLQIFDPQTWMWPLFILTLVRYFGTGNIKAVIERCKVVSFKPRARFFLSVIFYASVIQSFDIYPAKFHWN